MIRRFVLIVFLISSYIFIVSTDPQGHILNKAKIFCDYCFTKYKDMNLEYHVKTWSKKEKKRNH